MLYISKRFGLNKYAVMDTDDGVEEFLTWQEIADAVCNLGVEIKGVRTELKYRKNGSKVNMIGIDVYQNPDEVNTRQAKLGFMYGVDVRVNDGQVVGITQQSVGCEQSIAVRLSDYGTSCADYILMNCAYMNTVGVCPLTIVLDDKITVTGKSFKRLSVTNIVVDLREVTSDKTAHCVYKNLINDRYAQIGQIASHIVDNPDRYHYYCSVCVLNNGLPSNMPVEQFHNIVGDLRLIVPKLHKKYRAEWKSMSDCRFTLQGNSVYRSSKQYVIWAYEHQDDVLNMEHYSWFVQSGMHNLFTLLRNETPINSSVLHRFENYMTYFIEFDDNRAEIVEVFMKFCRRANVWLLRMGEASGWF